MNNYGTMTATGPTGIGFGGFGGAPIFWNQGDLSAQNGFTFSSVWITNSGSIAMSSGVLRLSEFVQTSGSTVAGTNFVADGNVTIQSGSFTGSGTVVGQVINRGELNPGQSLGTLISGVLSNSSTINMDIGGLGAGSGHDVIRVSGKASLAGTLNLSLLNGFVPKASQSFTVMVFTARSGVFANIVSPPGALLQPVYSSTNLVLNAVAVTNEPPLITLQPLSQQAPVGAIVSFVSAATGTAPLQYQWARNGNPLALGTQPSVTLNGIQNSDAGDYRLLVSNGGGSALSSNATLTVLPGLSGFEAFNLTAPGRLNASDFLNGVNGIIGGQNGWVRITRDGGLTWTVSDTGSTNEIFDVQSEAGAIWVFGSGGHICVSYDGGTTWTPMNTQTKSRFRRGGFVHRGYGYAVAEGGGIYCYDGHDWTLCAGNGIEFYGLAVWSDGAGGGQSWAVGASGQIWHYGGQWLPQYSAGPDVQFSAVRFQDAQHGFAVGGGGVIYRTLDGGGSWTRVNSGVTADLSLGLQIGF